MTDDPQVWRPLNHANVGAIVIYARLDLDPSRRALEDDQTMMLAAGKRTLDAQTKRSINTQRCQIISEVVDFATLARIGYAYCSLVVLTDFNRIKHREPLLREASISISFASVNRPSRHALSLRFRARWAKQRNVRKRELLAPREAPLPLSIRLHLVRSGFLRLESLATSGCVGGRAASSTICAIADFATSRSKRRLGRARGVNPVVPKLLAWRHSALVYDLRGDGGRLPRGREKARASSVSIPLGFFIAQRDRTALSGFSAHCPIKSQFKGMRP